MRRRRRRRCNGDEHAGRATSAGTRNCGLFFVYDGVHDFGVPRRRKASGEISSRAASHIQRGTHLLQDDVTCEFCFYASLRCLGIGGHNGTQRYSVRVTGTVVDGGGMIIQEAFMDRYGEAETRGTGACPHKRNTEYLVQQYKKKKHNLRIALCSVVLLIPTSLYAGRG